MLHSVFEPDSSQKITFNNNPPRIEFWKSTTYISMTKKHIQTSPLRSYPGCWVGGAMVSTEDRSVSLQAKEAVVHKGWNVGHPSTKFLNENLRVSWWGSEYFAMELFCFSLVTDTWYVFCCWRLLRKSSTLQQIWVCYKIPKKMIRVVLV